MSLAETKRSGNLHFFLNWGDDQLASSSLDTVINTSLKDTVINISLFQFR